MWYRKKWFSDWVKEFDWKQDPAYKHWESYLVPLLMLLGAVFGVFSFGVLWNQPSALYRWIGLGLLFGTIFVWFNIVMPAILFRPYRRYMSTFREHHENSEN